METLSATIEGMVSTHCQVTVRNAVARLPGTEIRNIGTGKAEITYDPAQTSRTALIAAIERDGYRVHAN
jgi:copper chaperone